MGVLFYPKIKRSKESKRYALLAGKIYGRAEEEMDLTLVPQSIRLYKEALRINPKNARALISLGTIYTMEGRNEDALTLYKKAVKIKPRSVRAHWFLAIQYDLMDMDAEADREYKTILKLDPDNFSAQLHFGIIVPEKDISLADILQDPEIFKIYMFAVMQEEAREKEKE